jgi:hypothetical protein
MAAWFEDQADIFLAGAEVTTAPVTDVGRKLPAWDLVEDLSCELSVTAAATDAGDSLIVVLQHSLDQDIWADLLTFSTVLGDGGAVSEKKSIGKGAGDQAWGPWLRALVTPAGAGAEFTIGELRIIGS